jgi:pentapeptide MXKDX repeat protein
MGATTTRLVAAVVTAGALAMGACTSSDRMMTGDKMGSDKRMGDTMSKDEMKKGDTMMEKK